MKLDDRQVRFVTPFWPSIRRHKVRLGGRRGSLHLQETALVAEGELIRFSFFSLEWLFRRALSEWTTVTVPYARIVAVRYHRLLWLRVLSALFLLAGLAEAMWLILARDPATGLLVFGLTIILGILLGYVNLRVKPSYRVTFRGKDGRRRMLAFAIRSNKLRRSFADALAVHQATAARYVASPDQAGAGAEEVSHGGAGRH
jgi:hypothetical protein